ncbi:MAG: hypothetical protein AW07_03810 [Candidatus Accumulibacter sp. SK-11]|nr:MAG: hypothetical protein AW07_03810 [Candidatus Accumulibacter sp. SK-11]
MIWRYARRAPLPLPRAIEPLAPCDGLRVALPGAAGRRPGRDRVQYAPGAGVDRPSAGESGVADDALPQTRLPRAHGKRKSA